MAPIKCVCVCVCVCGCDCDGKNRSYDDNVDVIRNWAERTKTWLVVVPFERDRDLKFDENVNEFGMFNWSFTVCASTNCCKSLRFVKQHFACPILFNSRLWVSFDRWIHEIVLD